MIGILDSGAGGLFALSVLREKLPTADLCFFADRDNAPYGNKERGELSRLLRCGIARLKSAGCDRILIACCTASTVFDTLSPSDQSVTLPIILPTARAAAMKTQTNRVAVISTEATWRSDAFAREISRINPKITVSSYPAQPLVSLIESGAVDGSITPSSRRKIKDVLAPLFGVEFDTLVLGCTHFSHIERELMDIFAGRVQTVSSAREGAMELIRKTPKKDLCGHGTTIYLC